jgi:VanZ family protein
MLAQARWPRRVGGTAPATAAWLGVVLALAAATLLTFVHMSQFEKVATPWPFDPGFGAVDAGTAPERAPGVPAPTAGWETEGPRSGISVEHGVVRLRNDDPAGGVGLRQLWQLDPGGPRAFRLAATVGSADIAGGGNGFKVGEITLVADGDIQRAFFHPMHRVANLRGSHAPARYVETFRFPSGAQRVELAIRLRHATGELTVGGLELRALGVRPYFRWITLALQLAWSATLAVGCWLFWRGVDHPRSALALVVAAGAGLGLLMMPEGLRDSTLTGLTDLLPRRLQAYDALATAGHFMIFAVAGLLVRLSRRREAWLPQVALLIGLAGLSELLQFLAELRSPTLDDWLTNAVGALLGWGIGLAWLWWRQDGQFATQRGSSTTLPPQPAKQAL